LKRFKHERPKLNSQVTAKPKPADKKEKKRRRKKKRKRRNQYEEKHKSYEGTVRFTNTAEPLRPIQYHIHTHPDQKNKPNKDAQKRSTRWNTFSVRREKSRADQTTAKS